MSMRAALALLPLALVAGQEVSCMAQTSCGDCTANSCYWCPSTSSCSNEAAWLYDTICELFSTLPTECTVGKEAEPGPVAMVPVVVTTDDKCAVAGDTCGDCTAASHTNWWGEYVNCAWCGDHCVDVEQATCATPQLECTGPRGSPLTCRQLGWRVAPGAVSCGASQINSQCSNLLTYSDAKLWCAQGGARLCSSDELASDVGMGSGCQLDFHRSWTRDICAQGHITQGASTASLAVKGKSCDYSNSLARVRCCGDSPRAAPLPQALDSVSSCESLGWAAGESQNVCASSNINGMCITSATFEAAQASCFSMGARLCSVSELENNAARGTGCHLDPRLVWSNTPCGVGKAQGVMAATGAASDAPSKCHMIGAKHGVRCCANFV